MDTTYERYEQLTRMHIIPILGSVKLTNLTPTHVRGLYKEALEQGVNYGLIPRNATEAVKPPKVHREEIHPLTAEQVKALLDAARGERLEALYVLAIHTGLRQGELLGLKWEDVNLEARTLQVRRTLTTARSGPMLSTPKTKGSRRSVRLTQSAV
ncbi:MAG: site-specific integrase, partial [Actinomycetota bacterium]|nr:site-specific integrase [Actinomycetota bacterium]